MVESFIYVISVTKCKSKWERRITLFSILYVVYDFSKAIFLYDDSQQTVSYFKALHFIINIKLVIVKECTLNVFNNFSCDFGIWEEGMYYLGKRIL